MELRLKVQISSLIVLHAHGHVKYDIYFIELTVHSNVLRVIFNGLDLRFSHWGILLAQLSFFVSVRPVETREVFWVNCVNDLSIFCLGYIGLSSFALKLT